MRRLTTLALAVGTPATRAALASAAPTAHRHDMSATANSLMRPFDKGYDHEPARR